MIIIPIMLLSARTGTTSSLGRITIANDGTGTKSRGNYKYRIRGKDDRAIAEGRIEGFPRTRRLAVDLLARVLADARRG